MGNIVEDPEWDDGYPIKFSERLDMVSDRFKWKPLGSMTY